MTTIHRSGSALILIMAILVLLTVVAFGVRELVSDHRSVGRRSAEDAVLTMALTSGRARALAEIERGVVAGDRTTLQSGWSTAFAPTAPWPGSAASYDPSQPSAAEATRTDSTVLCADRTGLLASAWVDANTADLWRFEPGLASTAAVQMPGTPHGHDDGFTSHDGTGRWFELARFDRRFDRLPAGDMGASLILQYAVGVIDQTGLLLGNKARYRHVDPGNAAPATIKLGGSASTASTGDWIAEGYAIPVAGNPDPRTDVPLPAVSAVSDTTLKERGYTRTYLNTMRPIPVDHHSTAHHLLTIGMGLDNSRSATFSDSISDVEWDRSPERNSAGQTPYHTRYVKRGAGDVPASWRSQGYYDVRLNFPQFSRRFGDFLPFEQSPHPTGVSQWNGGSPTSAADWALGRGFGSNNGARDTQIRNRHPLALAVLFKSLSGVTPAALAGDPYLTPLDNPNRVWFDLWNQIDLLNWVGMAQLLRVGPVTNIGTTTNPLIAPRPVSPVYGLVQCWTPFSSPISAFDDIKGKSAVLAGDVDRKNRAEMKYQWTININTAPPEVLRALVRLVIPATQTGQSAYSTDPSDRAGYETMVRTIAGNIIRGRPYAAGSVYDLATTAGWRTGPISPSPAAPPSAAAALRSLCYGPADPRYFAIRSEIHGGINAGAGAVAEFPILSISASVSSSATRSFLIAGRHLPRFWTPGINGYSPTNFQPDAPFRIRFLDGSGGTAYPPLPAPGFLVTNGSYVGSNTQVDVPGAALDGVPNDARVIVEYPGITLCTIVSRFYRVAVRARLLDLDNPGFTREMTWDTVLHVDPDRSGPKAGSGMFDTDVLYSDLENAAQYLGGGPTAVW